MHSTPSAINSGRETLPFFSSPLPWARGVYRSRSGRRPKVFSPSRFLTPRSATPQDSGWQAPRSFTLPRELDRSLLRLPRPSDQKGGTRKPWHDRHDSSRPVPAPRPSSGSAHPGCTSRRCDPGIARSPAGRVDAEACTFLTPDLDEVSRYLPRLHRRPSASPKGTCIPCLLSSARRSVAVSVLPALLGSVSSPSCPQRPVAAPRSMQRPLFQGIILTGHPVRTWL